ncbi:MAG: hypothetical protein ACD_3C00213G0002 [uncultured bacterium (gcode 4)]|uniref:DUF72 domain-containing protein n=1 Tax=uncultured bacterium (gcode 4) TaxID=1234023 RepID=K2FWM8_9BACT|nr:MAG: hypothetical protein ACD_3C00213G0002 [uncultured bacterium (gcode 4)]
MAEILIWTSGWMYKHWDKKFYPPEVKNEHKLEFISNHYKTLEVNTSFYHFVKSDTFKKWHDESAPWFTFSVKASRYYTHIKRLKIDEELLNSMNLFFVSLKSLGDKLWAILFQLPESFPERLERLDIFLSSLQEILIKQDIKPDIAFEFRHQSWFKDETYDILKKYNIALVIANSSRYPYEVKTTADFSYMRFHWPENMFLWKYSESELQHWKDEIDKFSAGLKRIYIYFNNDLDANAVENSDYLIWLFKSDN